MTTEDLQNIYDEIALKALNTLQIKRDGQIFDLVEVEVYLADPTKAVEDVFIHKNIEQLNDNGIYYHYSGIDICRGNEEKEINCGILIRGISREGETIYGPGKIAYTKENGKKAQRKIEEVKKDKPYKCVFAQNALDTSDIKNIVLKLPRVNLGHSTIIKHSNPAEVFKYLNLKARYLRLINGQLSPCKNKSATETREIYNAFYKYQYTQT